MPFLQLIVYICPILPKSLRKILNLPKTEAPIIDLLNQLHTFIEKEHHYIIFGLVGV